MNLQVYKFLKSEAEADKNKALASIELLTNHPAGIGDHSTKDYWDNCNEALRLLASADERLEVLEKYFNNIYLIVDKESNKKSNKTQRYFSINLLSKTAIKDFKGLPHCKL